MNLCEEPSENLEALLEDLPPDGGMGLLHLMDCPSCRDWVRATLVRRSAEAEAAEREAVERLRRALSFLTRPPDAFERGCGPWARWRWRSFGGGARRSRACSPPR